MRRKATPGGERVEVVLTPTPDFEEKTAHRSEQAAAASMARLFEPRSVAVIGASRERGKIGAEILHNLVATGFRGADLPRESCGGRRSRASAATPASPTSRARSISP